MNFQPPDPPDYGRCLTCNRVVHVDEKRGDNCIECDDQGASNGADENGVRPAVSEDGAYRFNPWTGQHE